MTSIKENERIGKAVEQSLIEEIAHNTCEKPLYPDDEHAGYDFSTPSTLYEVKSCHILVKNGFDKNKSGNKQKTRNGMFLVGRPYHEKLKSIADGSGKKVWYIFVLLDENDNIIKKRWMSWFDVQIILQSHNQRKNGDYQINYKFILGD